MYVEKYVGRHVGDFGSKSRCSQSCPGFNYVQVEIMNHLAKHHKT